MAITYKTKTVEPPLTPAPTEFELKQNEEIDKMCDRRLAAHNAEEAFNDRFSPVVRGIARICGSKVLKRRHGGSFKLESRDDDGGAAVGGGTLIDVLEKLKLYMFSGEYSDKPHFKPMVDAAHALMSDEYKAVQALLDAAYPEDAQAPEESDAETPPPAGNVHYLKPAE
jgi:hypothetical protein